ncbi:MAG: hypothetical protein KF858_03915 [Candidatus Sumerlaeia bacterium]|nr:hypothetical protein [Candidatus Sumerlaeia bacterium]
MPLFDFLVCLLAAYGAGAWVLRGLGGEAAMRRAFDGPVVVATRWALGVGVLGLVALGGTIAGALPRPVAAGLVIALAVLGAFAVRRTRGDFRLRDWRCGSWVERLGMAFCFAALLLHLRVAWSPHLYFDSFAYHVTMPRQYLLHGHFFATPFEMHPHLHALVQFQSYFGLALSPVDFIAPKLVQIAAMLGIVVLLATELRRLGLAGAGWVAGGWWMVMEESVEFAPTSEIELTLAFLLFLGFVLLSRAVTTGRHDRRPLLLLAGVVFGLANGTKNNAMVISALAAGLATVWLVVRAWRMARRVSAGRAMRLLAGDIVAPAVAGLLVTAPWLVKNAVITGNPFYPFLPDLFVARIEYDQVARDFLASYGNFRDARPGSIEWIVAFGRRVAFMIYTAPMADQFRIFAFFLMACGVWWLRRDRREPAWRFLLLAGVVLAPLVVMSPARRFVLVAVAIQLLVVVETLGMLAGRLMKWRVVLGRAMVAGVLLFFLPGQLDRAVHRIRLRQPLDSVAPKSLFLDRASVRAWLLAHRDGGWIAAIEREVGPDGRLLVTEALYANAASDVRILPVPNIHGAKMPELMVRQQGLSADELAAALRAMGITHVLSRIAWTLDPTLAEFERRWLEERRVERDLRLFRLRASSDE